MKIGKEIVRKINSKRKKRRKKKKRTQKDRRVFDINLETIKEVAKTTLMIKNIPNKYTKEMILEEIDDKFGISYDFFYLPIDFTVSRTEIMY